ncbi:tRNA N6-adenosine threonylcarbamoyltransferase [Parelaphostrongylus tenuis]|uniref:tRNA N6-adenosine threonylcarbamoyltransferase n=1 Tax=Parelaphostrongylus tenuis TaxID=148309 RepID=A0AAD5MX64_PARTN|nr:tRNA N6-adenosine threonylcarbamoyltransferase [Parelaphostrongylus tenuis]
MSEKESERIPLLPAPLSNESSVEKILKDESRTPSLKLWHCCSFRPTVVYPFYYVIGPKCGYSLSLYMLLNQEALLRTTSDYVHLVLGTLASFLHGAGFSVLGIVLGGMTSVFLRAQNSEFVVGVGRTDPKGLPGLTQEEFNREVRTYCYYYLVLGIAMFITSYVQIFFWETFAEKITHKLRQEYLRAILRQQISWFDLQQSGSLTARLTDWSMTLVMLIVAPLIVCSANWMSKILANRTEVEQEAYAISGSIAEETLSSIRTVHALCGHRRELNRFEESLEKSRKTGLVKYFYMGIGVGFGQLCNYISYALAFWYGSVLITKNPEIDRGFIFTRPDIDPYSLDGLVLNNLRGAIRFKNVHFSYPSRESVPVLKGVTFSVSAGQKIAIVGSSGCGKSTIVNLLLRFYDPTKGKVMIDDIDIYDLNVYSLREKIGVVSQEPILFDGTIYENIKLGHENATLKEIEEACKLLSIRVAVKP